MSTALSRVGAFSSAMDSRTARSSTVWRGAVKVNPQQSEAEELERLSNEFWCAR